MDYKLVYLDNLYINALFKRLKKFLQIIIDILEDKDKLFIGVNDIMNSKPVKLLREFYT